MKPVVVNLRTRARPRAHGRREALRHRLRTATTGHGLVFVTNPVQSLGDETLTDQKDADSAVPQAAYHDVAAHESRRQRLPPRRLRERRQRDREAGLLDHQHLPLHTAPGRVRAGHGVLLGHRGPEVHPLPRLRRDAPRDRKRPAAGSGSTSSGRTTRSRATTRRLELRFGKGGVDDAEDAEVILHEYGHAIHDSQNFSFATEEAGAISEGFGDYWAVTVGNVVATDARRGASRAARVRRGLGLDLLHDRRAALPAARRHEPALPGRSRRRGARRRPDLVTRALGHPRNALGNVKADTRHPPGVSSTSTGARCRRSQSIDGRGRGADAVRKRRRERRQVAFQARGILP